MTIEPTADLVTVNSAQRTFPLHQLAGACLSSIRRARQTQALVLLFAVCVWTHIAAQTQTSVTSGATSAPVLSQMGTAFSGGQAVHRVQLAGKATLQAGTVQDSGSVTFTASADGSWQMQLALAEAGQRSESRNTAARDSECQWSGKDGAVHEATGSCWLTVVWFLPQITLQPALPSVEQSTLDIGATQTAEGVRHVIQNQLLVKAGKKKASAAASTQAQKQSTSWLALDPVTALPLAMKFNLLSDSGTQQIPVEIKYSNYQKLSGLLVPTHIERYLNGSLELAFDVTQVSVLN